MLLDTDFLIALIRKKPEAIEKIRELETAGENLYITHINLCELYHGAFKSRNTKESLSEIEKLLEYLNILPFTREVDKMFGKLITELYEKGKPIGQMDTLIAAFAIEYEQKIITRNTKHFMKANVGIEQF